MEPLAYNTQSTPVAAHMCHCIGCCKKCGGCRTNPKHGAVCEQAAELQRQLKELYRD